VANFLSRHKSVTKVLYPFLKDHPQYKLAKKQMSGGGGVVTFEVPGGKKSAFKIAKALKLIDISNNLGDVKSLLTHPATTTHQRMSKEARLEAGVTDGMLRISVGLEDPADLTDDLTQALAKI
jgi:O-succinylhomoserine sulfhydrylase